MNHQRKKKTSTSFFETCITLNIRSLLFSFCLVILLIFPNRLNAQLPEIGAELFIEKGQSPEEIDVWVKSLKDNGFKMTRIRMFECYMRDEKGGWDFSLFDAAFKSADKYGIRVYGNLFPNTPFTDIGGLKSPRSEAHLDSIANYIKYVISHFSQYKSCIGWIPVNEPGIEMIDGRYSMEKFEEWKSKNNTVAQNRYEAFDFAEERFLLQYNTWFLKWLTSEIRKYDKSGTIHINGHQLLSNIVYYDNIAWRDFITSFGGSAHASWHFGSFDRKDYTVAMSATNEMIRSGAGSLPWFMTELQGGNNTYSGYNAMCPTAEETTQWIWINLFAEAKGSMFWCLNPRVSGIEAGEWAMLNFKNKPSDRMLAANNIIKSMESTPTLFSNIKEVESGINILHIRESVWVEGKLASKSVKILGRTQGAGMRSSLAFFQTLCEMGIQANLKEISEFDFNQADYSGKTIILSHQIAIPALYNNKLADFVRKGGRLILDGLTAYYDENAICLWSHQHPLSELLGGSIDEFKAGNLLFDLDFSDSKIKIPTHFWKGFIEKSTGKAISTEGDLVLGIKNNYGNGEVVWVPSPLGLGAIESGSYEQLSAFINYYVKPDLDQCKFRFNKYQKGLIMKTAKSGGDYITLIINKTKQKTNLNIETISDLKPLVVFSNKNGSINNRLIAIDSEESMVIKWSK